MNIIKQFEDPVFFRKQYYLTLGEKELSEGNWYWGLGDDGELYCSDTDDPTWYQYPSEISGISVDFNDMRRIVKQFGHLVIFT